MPDLSHARRSLQHGQALQVHWIRQASLSASFLLPACLPASLPLCLFPSCLKGPAQSAVCLPLLPARVLFSLSTLRPAPHPSFSQRNLSGIFFRPTKNRNTQNETMQWSTPTCTASRNGCASAAPSPARSAPRPTTPLSRQTCSLTSMPASAVAPQQQQEQPQPVLRTMARTRRRRRAPRALGNSISRCLGSWGAYLGLSACFYIWDPIPRRTLGP
jgi:hypothetical protein